jgi:hypothetical protein
VFRWIDGEPVLGWGFRPSSRATTARRRLLGLRRPLSREVGIEGTLNGRARRATARLRCGPCANGLDGSDFTCSGRQRIAAQQAQREVPSERSATTGQAPHSSQAWCSSESSTPVGPGRSQDGGDERLLRVELPLAGGLLDRQLPLVRLVDVALVGDGPPRPRADEQLAGVVAARLLVVGEPPVEGVGHSRRDPPAL